MNKKTPIKVAEIPVIPFESMIEILTYVFEGKEVVPGVGIAINPEKILQSIEKPEVKSILLDATLPFADGIGVVKALEKKSGQSISRIAGADLWLEIVRKSTEFNNGVFLLGSKPQVLRATTEKLYTETKANIVGSHDGYFDNQAEMINTIKQSGAEIVFVALGSPRQELFIKACKLAHPNAFYMGVGGSFDVYVGNVIRAPQFWINIHCEWLYRLLREPKRIFRQYRLLKYVYYYLFNKL